MQELSKFVLDCCNGARIDQVVPDGTLHRFKVDRDDSKESGYYIFFQNFSNKTAQPFYAGLVGSWRSGETWNYQSQVPLSNDDKKLAKKKLEEAQRKAEQEKLRKQ